MMLTMVAAGLMLVPAVTVDARPVTVGALVRNSEGGRLRGPVAARVVLRLPAGVRAVTLPAATVRALVQRQIGAASVTGGKAVTIALRPSPVATRPCWIAAHALGAGAVVTTDDVTPGDTTAGDCAQAAASIAVIDDAPVLRDAVAAGAVLGRLMPAPAGRVAAGTALTLRSVVGPVVVERDVTTLQPAHPGGGVFVRDTDGQVFAASMASRERAR